jgi:hypothetical protein
MASLPGAGVPAAGGMEGYVQQPTADAFAQGFAPR